MKIETINENNTRALANLCLEMFPENNFEEELEMFKKVLHSNAATCFLVEADDQYVGFIHLTLRNDYVEGSDDHPTAYVEAIFIKEQFRRRGIALLLLKKAGEWALNKGRTVLASDSEITNINSINFHINSGFEEANRVVCFVKKLSQ